MLLNYLKNLNLANGYFWYNCVGDSVFDVTKHPEKCVGADAHIRSLKNHTDYCFVILSEPNESTCALQGKNLCS